LNQAGGIHGQDFSALRHFDFLFETLEQMVNDAQRMGDDGERRIDRAAGRKEGSVHNVEIINVVSAAVEI